MASRKKGKAGLSGVAELTKTLRDLADPKAQLSALKSAVRNPMNKVRKQAEANIAAISPGKALTHKAYDGLVLHAGYAARSIRVKVYVSSDQQSATALLGVRPRAFYAVQFFELGTAYIDKQPWLVPAFEASKDESIEGIAKVLRARINRIAKQRAAGQPVRPE